MFIPYLGTDTSCEVMEVDPDGSEIDQLSEVNVTGDEEVQGRIKVSKSQTQVVLPGTGEL